MESNKDVLKMVKNMIGHYQVRVTPGQIDDFLLTHPDFPELKSISDAFDEWKIDHAAVKIKPGQLSDVSTPFLASLRDPLEPMRLVTNVDDQYVYYRSLKQKDIKAEFDKFSERWDGTILAIAPNEKSGEKDYASEMKKERLEKFSKLALLILALTTIILSLINTFTGAENSLEQFLITALALSTTGLLASLFLYNYKRHGAPAFIRDMCKQGADFNCNTVLQSKGSKLFGLVSWAEIGLAYFAGMVLSLLFAGSNQNTVLALSLLNIASLPYTIYSVYYQRFVTKTWCVLCLAVQGILWLQFVVFYFFGLIGLPVIDVQTSQVLLLSFGLPVITLAYAGTFLKNSSIVKEAKKANRRLKQNPAIFKSLLSSSRRIEIHDKVGFVLGNPEAAITLTCFISTKCSPCSKAHEVFTDLLLRFPDIRVQYIFRVSDDHEKQYTASYIAAVYDQHGVTKAQEALQFLFDQKDVEKLKRLYPVDLDKFDAKTFLNFSAKMNQLYQIEATPAVFINGYQLPDLYDIPDLAYWLPYIRRYLPQNPGIMVN